MVPQTYHGDDTSYLGSLSEPQHSVFTPDSPSRATELTHSCVVRYAAGSLSYSSSYLSGAESLSDRDNGSGDKPDLTQNTHVAMASAHSKVTHSLLTPDRQMVRLNRAQLLSTPRHQKKIRSPQLHHPVPPSMRLLAHPRLCHSHPC